jgi:hypothetical protein
MGFNSAFKGLISTPSNPGVFSNAPRDIVIREGARSDVLTTVPMSVFRSMMPFSLVLKVSEMSIIMMEVVVSPETSIHFYQTTQRHIPKDSTLQGLGRLACYGLPVMHWI